jgi:hypothetical protein
VDRIVRILLFFGWSRFISYLDILPHQKIEYQKQYKQQHYPVNEDRKYPESDRHSIWSYVVWVPKSL